MRVCLGTYCLARFAAGMFSARHTYGHTYGSCLARFASELLRHAGVWHALLRSLFKHVSLGMFWAGLLFVCHAYGSCPALFAIELFRRVLHGAFCRRVVFCTSHGPTAGTRSGAGLLLAFTNNAGWHVTTQGSCDELIGAGID